MGRWVRWFGSGEVAVAEPSVRRPPTGNTKVVTVSAEQAREVARSPARAGRTVAPTGAISIERLGAEMLTAVLVKEGVLSQADEHASLTEHRATGRPVEQILVESDLVVESDLLSILSRKCKVPHLSLQRYQIRDEVIETVPAEFARANHIIPLDRLGKVLNVATSNPLDVYALKRLGEETGLRVKPVLASPGELAERLDKLYPPPEEEAVPEPKEEVTGFSTAQIFKDSWLGLIGDKKAVAEEFGVDLAILEGSAEPEPGVEKAVPLAEDDPRSRAHATGGSLYRAWETVVGVGTEGDLATVPALDVEFTLVAAAEPSRSFQPGSEGSDASDERGPWWK
ncbi:MAG: GspE/PulE/PilB domain-containing protein, partial [Planctomycetota bacterium]